MDTGLFSWGMKLYANPFLSQDLAGKRIQTSIYFEAHSDLGSKFIIMGMDGQQCIMSAQDVRKIGLKRQELAVEGTFANRRGETILNNCIPLTTNKQQFKKWDKSTPKIPYTRIISGAF